VPEAVATLLQAGPASTRLSQARAAWKAPANGRINGTMSAASDQGYMPCPEQCTSIRRSSFCCMTKTGISRRVYDPLTS
jgi:hypothetical protein